MQDGAEQVEDAVLCGPAVPIPGFADRLAELLRLPVGVAAVSAPEGVDAPALTVAAGLAVADRP